MATWPVKINGSDFPMFLLSEQIVLIMLNFLKLTQPFESLLLPLDCVHCHEHF